MHDKQLAGILMGGYSGEQVISLKSGAFVLDHIDTNQFEPVKVILLMEEWYVEYQGEKHPLNKGDFSFVVNDEKKFIKLIYNTIHGSPGEDGYLQAYFDLLGIKYTGCDSYTSALTFNKIDCNKIVQTFGVKTAKSLTLRKKDRFGISYEKVSQELGNVFMVKACRSGSSIGVSKVSNPTHFESALENAFTADDLVLMETFISGTEVSVGAFRDELGEIQVMELTEIVTNNDFFDFNAKYEGASEEITPARVSPAVKSAVQDLVALVYDQLSLKGIVRIDFIIQEDIPYFIEVNTNPGMSPASIFPQQARYAGLDLVHLLSSQLQIANDN